MPRKEYDPAIAARVKKSSYAYLVDLAKRRSTTISDVVSDAIYQYEKKCREIDWKHNIPDQMTVTLYEATKKKLEASNG